MSQEKPSISVFFPFLNDWGTVGSLVALAASTVSKLTDDWEIIIVNDGSDAKNREALESIVDVINSQNSIRQLADKTQNNIKIITHEKNRGYGGALRSGFAACRKDLIFYTDCDGQYDPRELVSLYRVMEKGNKGSKRGKGKMGRKNIIGMVNGYKIKRHDPWYRTVAGRIYHHFVKFAFSLPIRDTDCDFRLIRKKVFNQVKLFENTGTICVELVKKIDHFGYKIAEVPVHHFWRTSGKSQFFNFNRLFQTAINLGKLWWKLNIRQNYDR